MSRILEVVHEPCRVVVQVENYFRPAFETWGLELEQRRKLVPKQSALTFIAEATGVPFRI